MTKRECAIIMAHTGICMLAGEDVLYFYKYLQDIMHRPVYTHELGNAAVQDEVKENSLQDFLELCATATDD